MENIYQEAINAVHGGQKFCVDFEKKSLRVNDKYLIRGGEFKGELGVEQMEMSDILSHIEELYDIYKHSVPSERSEAKRRRYFRALPEQELDDDDMLYGEYRDVAQISLELFILCCVLNGSFVWDESFGNWFWQSENDKDLVILRKWVS